MSSSRPINEKRLLVVLGYTENPQQNGTCCPYVTLPIDYFGKPDHAARVQSLKRWMPRLMAVLSAKPQTVTDSIKENAKLHKELSQEFLEGNQQSQRAQQGVKA